MNAWASLRYILDHPLNRARPWRAVWRWAGWQVGTRMRPGPRLVPFVDGTRLVVERGMTGATGNVYCGLHEFVDMAFTLHVLRAEDRFVDVGANVGSYAVLAAGVCGARVLALEPVASTFARLRRNIDANGLAERIDAHRVAAADRPGSVRFIVDSDTTNRIADDDDAPARTDEVPCARLDDLIGADVPQLIKIDVEGHESGVLRGASRVLADRDLRALIVELSGADREESLRLLAGHGFAPCAYSPEIRALNVIEASAIGGNALLVRDVDWARARVTAAPARRIQATGSLI